MKLLPQQTRVVLWLLFLISECKSHENLVDDSSTEDLLNSVSPSAEISACSNLLSRSQRQLCRSHPMHLSLLEEGILRAEKLCKRLLENDRWNCYSVRTGPAGLTHTLKEGSREASFVEALSAASMTTALARACARGSLSDCPCEHSWPGNRPSGVENHKWEGCSLDVRAPMKFVRKFLDTDLQKSQHPSSQMTLHNYNAGRLALKLVRKLDCRCHGTSGSCTFKTCYKRFGTFEEIGQHILKRYRNARHVHMNATHSWVEVENGPNSINSLTENRAVVKHLPHLRRHAKQRIKRRDLIFVSNATDYCNYDPAQGSLGTAGRRCTEENAEYLCCGRGYVEKFEIKRDYCHCRFTNGCCNLVCKTCYTPVKFGSCND
ncbi:protein Wnt-2b-A [Galendromus occidentalis]|uniref:Protein Wnt n=1 Tax=Galendromus occidentalis TaxID=34638 RepID=A0AAJ7PAN8_9ACAR|nr:protein Wnt-2b-A [Galendromus occidentalis]